MRLLAGGDYIEQRVTAARHVSRYIATLDPDHVAQQVGRAARMLDVAPSAVTAGVIDAVERGTVPPGRRAS
jgi:hypothetical protein